MAHTRSGERPFTAGSKSWLGIGGKLLAAFSGCAALTLLACGVALFSYRYTGASLTAIGTDAIPGINNTQGVARSASDLATASAVIAGIGSEAALKQQMLRLEATVQQMSAHLEQLSRTEAGAAAAAGLKQQADGLHQGINALAAPVTARLKASAERETLVAGIAAAHQAVSEILVPLVDGIYFNLVLGLESAGSEADPKTIQARLTEFADKDVANLQVLADLRADSNAYAGILMEAALAPRADLLTPLRDRLKATGQRMRKSLDKLNGLDQTHRLAAALEALTKFAEGSSDVLKVRETELTLLAQGWQLAADNRRKARELLDAADKAVATAESLSDNAVSASHSAIGSSKAVLMLVTLLCLAAGAAAWLYIRRGIVRQRPLRRHNGARRGRSHRTRSAQRQRRIVQHRRRRRSVEAEFDPRAGAGSGTAATHGGKGTAAAHRRGMHRPFRPVRGGPVAGRCGEIARNRTRSGGNVGACGENHQRGG